MTHGARLRLRPIIMTATATICALIPMGLGLTGGGAFISQPLAMVVIGGLVSSTVLTLLLVPVLYSLVERRGETQAAAASAAKPTTKPRAPRKSPGLTDRLRARSRPRRLGLSPGRPRQARRSEAEAGRAERGAERRKRYWLMR